MWDRLAASPSKSLLAMSLAFVAGVAAHAFDERPWVPVAWAAVAAVVMSAAAAAVRRRSGARLACVMLALASLAVWRYEAVLPEPEVPAVLPRGPVAFTGAVAEEPRDSLQGTVLVMDRVSFSDGGRMLPLRSGMEIRFRLPVSAAIGDALAWRCRGRPRDGAARERRDRGTGWTCMPDGPPDAAGRRGHAVMNALLAAKRRIRAAAAAVLPEPDASLVLGLLIGDTGGIPKDVLAAFRATGTSHVLAVSGYNVHLVVECAFMALAACAVGRRRASYAVAAALAAFTVMTGAEAPVVRAAVMGGLGLVAGLIGRRNGGAGPLAVAAAVMLAHDPLVLRHDVGFRLSFAAVLGLRAFGPAFSRLLAFLPEAAQLRRTCAETLAATVATLPIALYDFGLLPLAGPFANLAVVPLVPLLSAAGVAAVVTGMVYAPVALPLALPCAVLARLMLGAVGSFASVIPALPMRASAWQTAALYAWLGLLWYALTRKPMPSGAAAPDPPAPSVTYAP